MTRAGLPLLGMVSALGMRLTAGRALRTGARTAAAAIAAVLTVEAANLIVPLAAAVPVGTATIAAAAAGLILAAAALRLQRVDVVTASRLIDVRLGLDERTSTAVELLLAPGVPTPMGRRVIADATGRLAAIRGADAFPLRVPKEAAVAAVLALLLAAWALWVHGLTLPGTPARRASDAVRQEGRRIEQFAQSLQSRARSERSVQTRRMAGQMRELGSTLQRRPDRPDALARVGELARQAEAIRQQINERLRASGSSIPPAGSPPEDLFRRDAVQRQIRQLRELASRLRDPQASSQDLLNRLGQITREGEGTQPADAQRQLQQAREQLERGNAPGAGEALTQALRELEGLDTLLADQEGIRRAQQQLEQSREAIARGGQPSDQPSAEQQSGSDAAGVAPGSNRPQQEESADGSRPPQGPNEGVTPGTGQVTEQLGAPTARLQAGRTRERVTGAQREGEVTASEVTGAGRQNSSRVGRSGVQPAPPRQVDEYMERARIPARYRALIRAYFQRLAQLR
jgi:hypothetical protein